MKAIKLAKIYRDIIESSGLQIWAKDLDSRYIFASRAWFDYLGVPYGEIQSLTDFDLVGADLAAEFVDTDKTVRRSGSPSTQQVVRRENGETSEFLVQKFPIRSEDGDLIAIGGISTDISELNRLRRALEDKLAFVQGIFDAARNGIARLSPMRNASEEVVDFTVLEANTAMCEIAEIERDELIGQPLSKVMPDLWSGGLVDLFIRAAANSKPLDYVHERTAGQPRAVYSLTLNPLDKDVVLTAVDITREYESRVRLWDLNTELEKERTNFEILYRETPAITQVLDRDRHILDVSNRWLETFGYDREEVIGQKPTRFLTEQSERDAAEHHVPKFWRQGYINNAPVVFRAKDGREIETEVSTILYRTSEGERGLSVVADVTERNRARADLEEKNRQLEEANERLNQFTYAASHDLNEPLRKIMAFSDLLAESIRENDTEDIDYALKVISEAAQRGRQLVSDLLAYSRTSNRELDIETVDLAEITLSAIEDLSVMIAERGIGIKNEVANIQVEADPLRLGQLITNLLSNAIKYGPAEGEPAVRVRTEVADDAIVLSVTDNGIGVDPAYHQQIFEPFKRLHTREDYPGTGLGLAICARIAEQHGWTMAIDSALGAGSKFSVVIPEG